MRTYFAVLVLCFSSIVGFSQKLQLERASPFTAVKWENDQPIVQFENDWYTLEKLDPFTTEEIIVFCKHRYGAKWKKRFSEDLVDVLKNMGITPDENVKLTISKDHQQIQVIGTFTAENRQQVRDYNAFY